MQSSGVMLRAALAIYAIILCCTVGRPLTSKAAETPGRVTFSLPFACAVTKTHGAMIRIRSLSYSLQGSPNQSRIGVSFTTTHNSITWTTSIVPGVYVYDVYGYGSDIPGETSKGLCTGR